MIKIGVGACTVGQPVRFSGEAKKKNSFLEQLSQHVTLVPFCPEVGIGMGVPRETIRLVDTDGRLGARDSETQVKDYTAPLEQFAVTSLAENSDLAGYIGVKGSPTCGYQRVKIYNAAGNVQAHNGTGVFLRRLQEMNPDLPVEEDGRLSDAGLRDCFVTRVYVYGEWLELQRRGDLAARDLIAFYSRYKYLVMAYDVAAYRSLGQLVARAGNLEPSELAAEIIRRMMQAMKRPAKRKGYTNALQHIRGYLKRHLSGDEKRDIDRAIEQYRLGIIPLVVPMSLIQFQFNRHPDPYIADQVIMRPYPEELGLRNSV